MNTEKQKIQNRLTSDLHDLLHDIITDRKDKLQYFATFMQDAGVDPEITINVLERFGDEGKEVAMGIKINEGL